MHGLAPTPCPLDLIPSCPNGMHHCTRHHHRRRCDGHQRLGDPNSVPQQEVKANTAKKLRPTQPYQQTDHRRTTTLYLPLQTKTMQRGKTLSLSMHTHVVVVSLFNYYFYLLLQASMENIYMG